MALIRTNGNVNVQPLSVTFGNENSDNYAGTLNFSADHPYKSVKYVSAAGASSKLYATIGSGSQQQLTAGQSYNVEGVSFQIRTFYANTVQFN